MIALLTGRIARKAPDFIVLDVHGVGYRVHIPFSTYYELPPEETTVSLHIHTSVREDAILLYGFRTLLEKELFQLLISVSGVGPRLATGILSNVEPGDLMRSLAQGDLARLASIPGIGKKTAERLVLELKEKVKKVEGEKPQPEEAAATLQGDVREDVLSALVNLGYKESLVQKALGAIVPEEGDTVEALLRKALKALMK
ncbi:MAG TPA: Holliday junction branch migration protein RuvA [Verrucomicrobiae bacterium]|nr:Holliday junction branch migration protein RuvA [Verrucomicrobiae bacterium]